MDNTDFSFMKTGFDLVNNEEETKQNIVAMVTAFTEKALRTACIYVKHSPRDIVMLEDIKRSMMLEVFMFTKRPGIMEETASIRQQLFAPITEDDIEDDENDIDIEDDDDAIFCESECDCALCKCINTIYDRWVVWTPSNPWEIILKTHIDKMSDGLPTTPASSPTPSGSSSGSGSGSSSGSSSGSPPTSPTS